MSKKNRSLTFRDLPKATAESEVVEVPEFGEGFTVNGRGLTVSHYSILGAYMRAAGVDPAINGGRPAVEAMAEYQVINTALGAYDDNGNLVFGETPAEAINTVRSLPSQYSPAIQRISGVVTRLTSSNNQQRVVEDAEKN
jgi:hypothetical protein